HITLYFSLIRASPRSTFFPYTTLFRSTSNVQEKRNLIVFLRPTILADNTRLAALTQQRYLGVNAMQFAVDSKGELRRITPNPLPLEVDNLFDGRRVPDEELRRRIEEERLRQ